MPASQRSDPARGAYKEGEVVFVVWDNGRICVGTVCLKQSSFKSLTHLSLMKKYLSTLCSIFLAASCFAQVPSNDASEIVKAAIDHWRGTTSYVQAHMTIHRPTWERKMALTSWLKGRGKSLVRFTAPAKDAGSASLTIEDEMWTYSPKVNSVVKIPPSMKAQSWMGSDFSYTDLSKADDIINFYDHKIIGTEVVAGQKIYTVESTPHESSPVVWGKEVLKIRADNVMLQHDYYDQDGKLVKSMTATDITVVGGRIYAKVMKMRNLENADEWTEVVHDSIEFGKDIPESAFTLSNLQNPRNF